MRNTIQSNKKYNSIQWEIQFNPIRNTSQYNEKYNSIQWEMQFNPIRNTIKSKGGEREREHPAGHRGWGADCRGGGRYCRHLCWGASYQHFVISVDMLCRRLDIQDVQLKYQINSPKLHPRLSLPSKSFTLYSNRWSVVYGLTQIRGLQACEHKPKHPNFLFYRRVRRYAAFNCIQEGVIGIRHMRTLRG